MKPQILVPDLYATAKLDLVELLIKRSLSNAEFILSKNGDVDEDLKKEAKEIKSDCEKELAEHKQSDSTPYISIGYIPIKKLTELNNWRHIHIRENKEFDTLSLDAMNESNEIQREYVRWGVKGHHNLDLEYTTTKEKYGSKEWDITTDGVVEMYEAMGLLSAIFTEVLNFNSLSEEKKRELYFTSGKNHMMATAKSANKNQS